MSSFKIVAPMPVADANLVSSSVPENDFPEWSATTNYAVGARVIRAARHEIYERLIAGTTSTVPELDKINWVYVSRTNRWKMFDQGNSSSTTSSTTLSVVIKPLKLINTIAALNVVGGEIRFRVVHPELGTVYDETRALDGRILAPTWFNYFFDPLSFFSQFIALNVATFGTTVTIFIDVTPLKGVASIGTFLMGSAAQYGDGVQYGARVGIVDYSRKETDQFGETLLVQRAFSKRAEFEVWLDAKQTDSLIAKLTSIRATPTLFVATEQYESTTIYGIYKDFDTVLSYPDKNILSIQLEGLT